MYIQNTNENDLVQNEWNKLDSVSKNHSERVWEIACEIECYYNHPDNLLSQAAYVHDIGKIYIPGIILDKTDVLTIDERDIIDRHAYLSYRILVRLGVEEEIARIALYHHGTDKPGYRIVPEWTGDKKIFEYASMLETIDMYEALTTDRPYHRRRNSKDAIKIIIDNAKPQNVKVIDYLRDKRN